jgi:predicted anti-sigma-YlaC factor YlaD
MMSSDSQEREDCKEHEDQENRGAISLCNRCRNLYAHRADLYRFTKRIAHKRPDQLSSKEKLMLQRCKDLIEENSKMVCSCGSMVK